MTIKHKIFLSALGLTIGMAAKYQMGPSIKTLGADFTPAAPVASSIRIPGHFSNNTSFQVIDNRVNRFINKWDIAGASVAIAKDGKLVFAKGYGYADKENSLVTQPHHLFRVASISKLITAVGIMKMVEDGKLSLDQKVFGSHGILSSYPYSNYIDKRVEDIKVIHLLNHSAGWTTRWGDPMFMPLVIARGKGIDLPVSAKDIISFMLDRRLHFTPGTMSSYSNLGYAILGKVIEEISGQDYESYIRTRILYPLGIFDMRLGGSFPGERVQNEVKYYEPVNNSLVEDFSGSGLMVRRAYGGNDINTLGAAGGWIASATDILRFMLAIDGYPEPVDILREESILTMTNPVSQGFHPLGWRNVNNLTWYRTGSLAGTSTLMVRREDGISYVILLNSSSWKGAMLSGDTRYVMDTSIAQVVEWPSRDLFYLASDRNLSVQRDLVVF